jgi:O-antigen/teichoic acid export membrane protein
MLLQVVLAPVVLKVAGRETLGAFAAIMQALGLLAILNIVGSWSLERFLAQSTGLDDGGARFRRIFSTARVAYLLINCVFVICVLIFSAFVGRLFHLSPGVTRDARHALYLLAVWTIAVRCFLSAYDNALMATQDIAVANLISALGMVVRALAALGFVLMGWGLLGLVMGNTAGEGVSSVLDYLIFRKRHPELMPRWGLPDKILLREMLSFGGHAAVVNTGSSLMFSSGNTLAGMTEGAAAASVFYTSQMPTLAVFNLLIRMNSSTLPALNELYGRGELDRVGQTFVRLTRLLLLLILPLAAGVLLFNRDIVVFWVGPQQYAGTLLTAALSAYCVVNALQGIAVQYSVVFGWIRFLAVSTIIQGVANFGLGFCLGRWAGLGGITLALVIVLLPQVVILLHKISNYLKVRIVAILATCALRSAIPLVAATVVGFAAHRAVHVRTHHPGGLLLEGSAFVVVYAALAYFLTMANEDRDDVNRVVRGLLRKCREAGLRISVVSGR